MSSVGKAIVTGASSGIGAVYADRLAKRGYDLIVVARDKARLEALASRLNLETGAHVEIVAADLSDRGTLDTLATRFAADTAINFLVNCAGLGPVRPTLGGGIDRYDTMMAVNIHAVQRLTFAAAEAFVPRGTGTIVNIASVVVLLPERFNAAYVAGKAHVLALTQSLAAEVGSQGVRLQAVLPGITRTEIFDRAGFDLSTVPESMIMEPGDLVDAALAGLDQGELVTIPSLPNAADWQAFEAARLALSPNISHSKPAPRLTAGSSTQAQAARQPSVTAPATPYDGVEL